MTVPETAPTTVAELSERVGQEIGLSDWHEVTQAKIDAYADVSGDHQFIHTDPHRAAQTPFGGTIAHGFLTVAMLSVMSYDVIPLFLGTKMSVNYGLNRLRFLSPVPSGARIRGRFVLAELTENVPGEITLIWDVTVEIEGAERPALVAQWITRRYLETDQ